MSKIDINLNKIVLNEKEYDLYLSESRNINCNDLEKLCDAVGWVKRPVKKVQIAIDNSFLTLSLFCRHNSEIKLIGFARATSDFSFNATIWDVVIDPDFQYKGLGRLLMKEMIDKLKLYNINYITLFADPQVVKFYKELGFKTDPNETIGMFWYPK